MSAIFSEIWVIGDSIVKRAETYAKSMGCQNLGQEHDKTIWMGKSGMRWGQLLPAVQYHMISRGSPKILIIHLGGNDIDTVKQIVLRKAVQNDLDYLQSCFPTTVIVWCDILPRLYWRKNLFDSHKVLNLKRKRINRAAHERIRTFNLGRLISPHILTHMTELFHTDGVHLSEFGNLTYIQTLKNSIRQFSLED